MSEDFYRDRLGDPSLPAADLAQIAGERRDLLAVIAAHPNAYPDLLTWIAAQGDPEATAVVEARAASVAAEAPAPSDFVAGAPSVSPEPGGDAVEGNAVPSEPISGGYGAPAGYPTAQYGAPVKKSRRGLIIGLVAAGVFVLAGLIVGGIFLAQGVVGAVRAEQSSFCSVATSVSNDLADLTFTDEASWQSAVDAFDKLAAAAPSESKTVYQKFADAYQGLLDGDYTPASELTSDDVSQIKSDFSECNISFE